MGKLLEKRTKAPDRTRKLPQSEGVYQILLEKISSLELAPGEALNETDLVESLGVGRTPIREAIQRLVQHGLITSRPYQPATVTPLNAHEISQIVELRIVLEVASARNAALRATAEQIDAIRVANDAYNRAVRSNSPRMIIKADSELHAAIANAANNRHLSHAISWNRDFGYRLWHLAVNRGNNFNTKLNAHDPIVDAIEQHDPDRAEDEMKRHIDLFRKSLSLVLSGQ